VEDLGRVREVVDLNIRQAVFFTVTNQLALSQNQVHMFGKTKIGAAVSD
jgi:hypothetical protein